MMRDAGGPTPGCDREREVITAIRTAEWSIDLERHLAACAECRTTRGIAAALAAGSGSAEPPPDADRMWERLQVRGRHEAAERAERPMVWAHRVVLAALAGCSWVTVIWTAELSPAIAWVVAAGLGAMAAPGAVAMWMARE